MAERSILTSSVVMLEANTPFSLKGHRFDAGRYSIQGAGEMWRLDGDDLAVPRMLCATEVLAVVDADGMKAAWTRPSGIFA